MNTQDNFVCTRTFIPFIFRPGFMLFSFISSSFKQIHEDVARSAAKHYQKLAKKLSRADQAFVARFLDKGSLEMLGAKLHVVSEDIYASSNSRPIPMRPQLFEL